MRATVFILFAAAFLLPAETPMQPFTMDHRSGGASLIDLSFLLDAPAGKRGFARVKDGHLVTGDGKRLRLWGVNVTEWSKGSTMLPSKEDAAVWAATLARFGVNCVRLHFLDLPAPRGLIDPKRDDTRSFDAEQLDRLDYWIAELKKRGIYIDINLNVGRSYKPGDGVTDAEKIRWGKGVTLYNPRLIELQKEYAKQLLTHRNPYTKLEYRADPAVVIVELLNENALYLGFRAPTPAYDKELSDIYNAWLRERLPTEELSKLRAIAGVTGDAPMPRLSGRDVASAPKERLYNELRFFGEMESRFYRDMTAYLREIGVKVPIIATADHSHSGSSYPMLCSTSLLDIVDGHTYWQHPGSRGKVNTPMVNQPNNSTVVELSRTAFAGKPYTVSEVNHPFPNEYSSEGIPILAAYSALQDWDGVFWYTFEPKVAKDWKPYIGDPFDISLDPVKMPQLAAGALLYLRGDVAAAKTALERSYTREQVYESVRLPGSERPYFTPGFPLTAPLRQRVGIRSLDGPATAKFEPVPAGDVVSDTGELTWSFASEKGGVTVDTARSQALIGFAASHRKKLRHLTASLDNEFAAVVLAALDDRPIARSNRMLLTAGARAGNTGMVWNDARTNLKQWGGPPTVIEPVSGRVLLRGIERASAVTVAALDGAGRKIGEPITAQKTDSGWEFRIGDPVTTWYEVSVRR